VDQREEQEFAEYFTARRDAMRRMAYLICGDWHRADDLVQIAFVSLHRNWRKVRDKKALDSYLRRALTRAAIDEARRPWRRERSAEQLPDPPDPAELADTVANRQALLAALRKVPARQRAVLVLRFLEGLDVAGVARVMRCSEGTVKSQAARGLRALRTALGSDLDDLWSRS
jgi:RNA polymerase sigma-70 factor (sigma-E family)